MFYFIITLKIGMIVITEYIYIKLNK